MIKFLRIIFFILSISVFNLSDSFGATPATLDFVRPPDFSNMSVSPDGKYAAFTKSNTQKYCLDRFKTAIAKSQNCLEKYKVYRTKRDVIVIDLMENKAVEIIKVPADAHVSWIKFIDNSRLLISVSSVRTIGRLNFTERTLSNNSVLAVSIGGDKLKFESIEIPALSGTNIRFRSSNRASINLGSGIGAPAFLTLPDENEEFIVLSGGRYGILKKVSAYSEKSKDLTINDQKTYHWLLDNNADPIVKLACYKKNNCDKIEVFMKNESRKWDLIYDIQEDSESGYKTEVFHPYEYDSDTGNLSVISRTNTDKNLSLKIFDPRKKQFIETIYEHETLDIDHLIYDFKNDVIGVATFEERANLLYFDPALKQHYEHIKSQFDQDKNIWIIDNNISGERAMVFVSSHHSTGKYYIYNPKTGHLAFGMDQDTELAKSLDSRGEIIKIKMRDGYEIDAYRYFPKQKNNSPLIVLPHGGPQVRDYFTYQSWVQFFVSRGYQVVQLNFRGSSGYGTEHELAGYGEWGGLMQDDITDTVKYLHDKGYATPQNTCIFGYSYGGYAALYGGATTPELYACIVSGGGISNLVKLLRNDKIRLNDQSYAFLEASLGDLSDKGKLREKSPIELVENYTAPVLLLHGERDYTVGVAQSREMINALKKENKDVTYVELEDEIHDGWSIDNEILFLESVESFLSEHIGSDQASRSNP